MVMRLKRILAVPFALAADVVTLGNMGERSFTQQLFDAERREKSMAHELALLGLAVEIGRLAANSNAVQHSPTQEPK
jgi:hypothetical protein